MIYITYTVWVTLHLACIILATIVTAVIYIFIEEQYESWKDKLFWRQYRIDRDIRLHQQYKLALHKKEQEKYPLFFWRELCSKQRKELLDGSV